jgi:hypothetical protein
MREEDMATAAAQRQLEDRNRALTLEAERVQLENASLLDEVSKAEI